MSLASRGQLAKVSRIRFDFRFHTVQYAKEKNSVPTRYTHTLRIVDIETISAPRRSSMLMSEKIKPSHAFLLSFSMLGFVFMWPVVGAAAISRSCDQDWVCIETDRSGGDVDLYLVNKGRAPVAITVTTRTSNLASRDSRTFLKTVPAGRRTLAASYIAIDRNKKTRFRYWFDWAVGDHHARHDNRYNYRLPYATGHRFRILQGFGSNFSHKGREQYAVDFSMPSGTPVHAAREGVVANVEESHNRGCWERGCGKYANFIVILHADGTTGEYYHLRQNGAVVNPGDRVERGQLIAYSGNTGHTTMPHLHFAVYRPVKWGQTQSLPIRFQSTDGLINRPRSGRLYRAD